MVDLVPVEAEDDAIVRLPLLHLGVGLQGLDDKILASSVENRGVGGRKRNGEDGGGALCKDAAQHPTLGPDLHLPILSN